MGIVTSTPPPRLPLTLDECKDFARVFHDNDDAELEPLLEACVTSVENWLGRRLITQTIDWTLDFLPTSARVPLWLPLSPAQSVVKIDYLDDAGISQEWTADQYQVDLARVPGRIMPAPGAAWPPAARDRMAAVTIRYVVGYGDQQQDVPRPILVGIKQQFATYRENPSGIVTGTNSTTIDFVLQNLLQPYQVADFATPEALHGGV